MRLNVHNTRINRPFEIRLTNFLFKYLISSIASFVHILTNGKVYSRFTRRHSPIDTCSLCVRACVRCRGISSIRTTRVGFITNAGPTYTIRCCYYYYYYYCPFDFNCDWSIIRTRSIMESKLFIWFVVVAVLCGCGKSLL